MVGRAVDADPFASLLMALPGLLLLCGAEIAGRQRSNPLWLADSCVLVTLWIFGVYYGISNVVFLYEKGVAGAQFADFSAMTDLTLMASGACFLMWRGYGAPFLRDIAKRLTRLLPVSTTKMEEPPQLVGWVCTALVLLSIAARLINIGTGTFGYSQEEESSERWLDYSYAFRILGSFGLLVLTGVSLVMFKRTNGSHYMIAALTVLTLIEIAFGFLSGFKQGVVLPILIVAACYYVARAKFPAVLLGTAAATLFLAYFVVQPFRSIRFEDSGFDPYSVISIAEALTRVFGESQSDSATFFADTVEQIAYRLNLTGIGAEGLVFAREVGLADGDPDFLGGFFLFPFLAYVPRIMWPGKPLENLGGWYTQVVLGRPEDLSTSSGMGPITFLYFGGGVLAVLLGFLVLGMVYRLIQDVLLNSSIERAFLYISILPTLVVIEAGTLHTVLVTLLRVLPILLIVQYLMFSRRSNRAGMSQSTRRERMLHA